MPGAPSQPTLPPALPRAGPADERVVLRLDRGAAEYEASIQVTEESDSDTVDAEVESPEWRALRPEPAAEPQRTAFVDGVRRIEHRLVVSVGERTVFGLLGGYGVGAVVLDGTARVVHEEIGRLAIAAGGVALSPFRVQAPGLPSLAFEPRTVAANTPIAPVEGLQTAMREAEARLAARVAEEVEVVFQDGPLSFLTADAPGCVIGFVKRMQRQYLDAGRQSLLPRLAVGERTPLFLIGGREPRYSWYLRIACGRAIDAALTGVVRLECPSRCGTAEARRRADVTALAIPRLASDASRDPRAPQNLHPIGGLEARLKHLLGDPAVVRRAIEAQIHSEVTP